MQADLYARWGHRKVHGWLDAGAAKALVQLARIQQRAGVKGGACEIGVHHGRLFILLHLLTDGPSVAIDLFDAQSENLDHSGYGSCDRLLANIRRFGDADRVRIIAGNSLKVTDSQILAEATRPARLFSVDGGHTAEVTYNDLGLAYRATGDGGLIILDDYFNVAWPAVSEGTCRFMREHHQIEPVLIVGNKFIFAKGDAGPYLAACAGDRSVIYGKPVAIVNSSLRSRLARSWLWRQLRKR